MLNKKVFMVENVLDYLSKREMVLLETFDLKGSLEIQTWFFCDTAVENPLRTFTVVE